MQFTCSIGKHFLLSVHSWYYKPCTQLRLQTMYTLGTTFPCTQWRLQAMHTVETIISMHTVETTSHAHNWDYISILCTLLRSYSSHVHTVEIISNHVHSWDQLILLCHTLLWKHILLCHTLGTTNHALQWILQALAHQLILLAMHTVEDYMLYVHN